MTPAARLHNPHLSFSAPLIFAQTFLISCYLPYAYDVIYFVFMLLISHVGHVLLIYAQVVFGIILIILLFLEV